MFDVVLMLVFGVLGYLFKKLKYPLAPLVLALVLGDMAEASFRQAMLLSQAAWRSSGRTAWSAASSLAIAMMLVAAVGHRQVADGGASTVPRMTEPRHEDRGRRRRRDRRLTWGVKRAIAGEDKPSSRATAT